LAAMPFPIMPSPIKPTRICPSEVPIDPTSSGASVVGSEAPAQAARQTF
jgi:hypothetical protein